MSIYWDTSTKTQMPKSWSSMEDKVVPLRRNLSGHPLAGLLWERQFEKVLLEHGWGRSSELGTRICKPRKRLFLSVYVDDIKLAGKKQNIDPMWKVPMKEVDLGEPTSFLEQVYLGCTQRESRDEWNNRLHLFNISIFSSASCPEAMSKRMQNGTGEERIVAKSKLTLNLSRTLRQALQHRRVRVHQFVRRYSEHPVSKVRIS